MFFLKWELNKEVNFTLTHITLLLVSIVLSKYNIDFMSNIIYWCEWELTIESEQYMLVIQLCLILIKA